MTRWHNYYADGCVHFCTMTVRDWEAVLYDESIDVLYEVWNEAREALGVKILACVVMPEHVHILVKSEKSLDVRDFLQRTASFVSKRLKPGGGFWKERPRVLPVYSSDILKVKLDYIHHNPVKRGLAENPSQWEHSSFHQIVEGRSDVVFVCDEWDVSVS